MAQGKGKRPIPREIEGKVRERLTQSQMPVPDLEREPQDPDTDAQLVACLAFLLQRVNALNDCANLLAVEIDRLKHQVDHPA